MLALSPMMCSCVAFDNHRYTVYLTIDFRGLSPLRQFPVFFIRSCTQPSLGCHKFSSWKLKLIHLSTGLSHFSLRIGKIISRPTLNTTTPLYYRILIELSRFYLQSPFREFAMASIAMSRSNLLLIDVFAA